MGVLKSCLFPPPPSMYVLVMSLLSFISCAVLGLLEVMDRHVQYSKFWNANTGKEEDADIAKVPTRPGMLITYSPALAVSAVSLAMAIAGGGSLRVRLLSLVLALHFGKRVLETKDISCCSQFQLKEKKSYAFYYEAFFYEHGLTRDYVS